MCRFCNLRPLPQMFASQVGIGLKWKTSLTDFWGYDLGCFHFNLKFEAKIVAIFPRNLINFVLVCSVCWIRVSKLSMNLSKLSQSDSVRTKSNVFFGYQIGCWEDNGTYSQYTLPWRRIFRARKQFFILKVVLPQ